MRFTDLNPRWIEVDGRRAGVSFDCPCCIGAPAWDGSDPRPARWLGSRLAVFFANPIDGGPPHPVDSRSRYALNESHGLGDHHIGAVHWQRTGDTFETLTLSPSIDCSAWKHWHGFVTNGGIA